MTHTLLLGSIATTINANTINVGSLEFGDDPFAAAGVIQFLTDTGTVICASRTAAVPPP